MTHTAGDANKGARVRSQGVRKSNFPAQQTIPADAFFDFVSEGHNIKISVADLLTALGVTGSIIQVGDSGDVPVLDDQGSVKGIRNIAPGFGISASINGQNSLEISTDFTFDETGVPLVDDPLAPAAVFRSLVAGPGINIASVPGQIQIASTVVPASTKTVIVAEKSDFPAPSAGVITLAADTEYRLTDDVSVGTDRFVLGNDTNIRASSSGLATLEYTGTGIMLTGVGISSKISQIRIDCPNGTLLNIDGGGTGIFQMLNMTIGIADKLGTLTDLAGIQLSSILFGSITTNGLLFTGSHGAFLGSTLLVTINGGTLLDLGTATFDGFSFTTAFPTVAAGATMVSGATGSANINTGGFGTIENVVMNGLGAALVGITVDDVEWQFALNNTIADTRPDALLFLDAPETTIITTISTPVLINGDFTEQLSSQFTISSAGRATYIGVKPAKFPITVTLSQEPVSGTNKDVTAYIAINGVVQIDSGIPVRISTGSPKATPLIWQHDFQPSDFVEVFVENNSDTIDIQTNNLLLRVN